MIIFVHESFPFAVAKLIQGYEEWYGSTVLRFPDEVFTEREVSRHWAKHIIANLKDDQKRPFVLAVDDGRRTGLSDRELRQSKCSFIILHSTWFDRDRYEWAWKILKAWPEIITKCEAAFALNKQCKLSVSINGRIVVEDL